MYNYLTTNQEFMMAQKQKWKKKWPEELYNIPDNTIIYCS